MNRLATLLVLTLAVAACTEAGPFEANPEAPALAVLADGGPRFSPWSPAAAVGSPITTPNYWEACPFIAKDGLNLFFRKEIYHSPFGWRWEIFVSHRETVEDPWGDPVNLGANINPGPSHQLCSFVTIDGHWLYFVSNRTDLGSYGGFDLFVSHRKDKTDPAGWETPVNLGANINSPGSENGPSVFEDEATGETIFYFSSSRNGNLDIYSSPMIDKLTMGPASPVVELNSPYTDGHAFIRRRDGLEVIFFSDRPDPAALGGYDLYVATRPTTADAWSTPVNLGPDVNSSRNEGRPSLSWDGTTLYFWTNREWYAAGGYYNYDVYQATRTPVQH